MMRSDRRMRRISHAGLTLVELMLALAITGMVGVGISSMMTMVATGTRGDMDGRSAVLRTHAAGMRMRAYLSDALCVLQHDPDLGIAVWLHDVGGDNRVAPSEVRVFWWDALSGSVEIERLDLPETWTPLLREIFDQPVALNSDFFQLMSDYRAEGMTVRQTMVEGVSELLFDFPTTDVSESESFDLTLRQTLSDGRTHDSLLAFGLAYHRRPDR
jgi:hypothetical protein